MNRSFKIYNEARDMKRGYCEWIPDSFDSPEGYEFVQRLFDRMITKVGEGKFRF